MSNVSRSSARVALEVDRADPLLADSLGIDTGGCLQQLPAAQQDPTQQSIQVSS